MTIVNLIKVFRFPMKVQIRLVKKKLHTGSGDVSCCRFLTALRLTFLLFIPISKTNSRIIQILTHIQY